MVAARVPAGPRSDKCGALAGQWRGKGGCGALVSDAALLGYR
jgi:hypothetical protein